MELWLLCRAEEEHTSSAEADALADDAVITLDDGAKLTLNGPYRDLTDDSVPSFACVSYVWGSGRKPNPLRPGTDALISDKTLPALASAVQNSAWAAFWVDVFCIPAAQPQRGLTLESMGFIYSRAGEVLVALEPAQAAVLEATVAAGAGPVDERALLALERDEWINSVWTYQEVVNCGALRFVAARCGSRVAVDGEAFFDRVGEALVAFKAARALSAFDVRRAWPALDAFEDLLADWLIAGYAERSALQVMSNLDRRVVGEGKLENYFYALIGSISDEPSRRFAGSSVADVAEKTLRICEGKGDYSFIYTVNERDKAPGRFWRPVPGPLRAILHWHCKGEQKGWADEHGLTLEGIISVAPTEHLAERARDELVYRLSTWEQRDVTSSEQDWRSREDDELIRMVHAFLQKMGYTGTVEYLPCATGVLFLQKSLQGSHIVRAGISKTLRWMFGAPGMVVLSVNGELRFSPGVFVGVVDQDDEAADFLLPL